MTTKERVLNLMNTIISTQTDLTILSSLKEIFRFIVTECHEPQVKQLEWYEMESGLEWYGKISYLQIAYIQKDYDNYLLWLNGSDLPDYEFETLKKAKAYAQQHFENLIRGCYES